jgi:hypothetical protein
MLLTLIGLQGTLLDRSGAWELVARSVIEQVIADHWLKRRR